MPRGEIRRGGPGQGEGGEGCVRVRRVVGLNIREILSRVCYGVEISREEVCVWMMCIIV